MALTQERLKELLKYDPETGLFYWLEKRGRRQTTKPAGTITHYGYVAIRVDGKTHGAHRLVFLYMNGSLPIAEVDHVNGDVSDNSFKNLRECSHSENLKNMKRHSDGSSGFKGVYSATNGATWFAQIHSDGALKYLGSFPDKQSAADAYDAAARNLHGEFARLNEAA